MARPKKILKLASTPYFQNFPPLWVPPGQPAIDVLYHDAVDALVDWIGPNWADNNETAFFPIRHYLIKSCKSWAAHDWLSDASWIEKRRTNAKNLPELDRTFTKFLAALGKAPFMTEKKMLAIGFSDEFGSKLPNEMTNKEAIDAVDRALKWYSQRLKVKDRGYARFGAIEYAGVPKQLPRKEVAIALSLADQITFWRRDGLSEGTNCCPHKPSLSRNLPWKAIAFFASANSVHHDSELTASNVQTLVASLARKVAFVHWRGEALKKPESNLQKNALA